VSFVDGIRLPTMNTQVSMLIGEYWPMLGSCCTALWPSAIGCKPFLMILLRRLVRPIRVESAAMIFVSLFPFEWEGGVWPLQLAIDS